jgi:hypothetical protein
VHLEASPSGRHRSQEPCSQELRSLERRRKKRERRTRRTARGKRTRREPPPTRPHAGPRSGGTARQLRCTRRGQLLAADFGTSHGLNGPLRRIEQDVQGWNSSGTRLQLTPPHDAARLSDAVRVRGHLGGSHRDPRRTGSCRPLRWSSPPRGWSGRASVAAGERAGRRLREPTRCSRDPRVSARQRSQPPWPGRSLRRERQVSRPGHQLRLEDGAATREASRHHTDFGRGDGLGAVASVAARLWLSCTLSDFGRKARQATSVAGTREQRRGRDPHREVKAPQRGALEEPERMGRKATTQGLKPERRLPPDKPET